jgi:hypothetical protein
MPITIITDWDHPLDTKIQQKLGDGITANAVMKVILLERHTITQSWVQGCMN